MARPALPLPKDIADIARRLREEGFGSLMIETLPDGGVRIQTALEGDVSESEQTPLEKWRAGRATSS